MTARIMHRTRGKGNRAHRGNMSFAIIAVTLLILGSAYVAASSLTEKSVEQSENITSELDNLGDAIENTADFVERGLGEIIFSLCTSGSEGTVSERAEKYKDRAEDWMNFQFPLNDKGVRVELMSFSTELGTQVLKMSEAGNMSDGYMPSYLVGSGTFTAKYISESGVTSKTLNFETDASCALPLVAEQGSLFKNAVCDSGTALSQMMTYQLTALAQHRVLNGYGASYEFGERGTKSILTSEDVKTAYGNSIKILGLKYFHVAPEGLSADTKTIELADYLIAQNGNVQIDISAIYAQAIMSQFDDIILKTMAYLDGNLILGIMDGAEDIMRNLGDSFLGFVTGKNRFTAAPYITDSLKSSGLNVNHYRYMYSDRNYTLDIEKCVYADKVCELLGITEIKVPYPNVDLMNWGSISDFKKTYRADNNMYRDILTTVLNDSAMEIASKKSFGVLTFQVNSMDNETFFETLASSVESALRDGDRIFESVFSGNLYKSEYNDPFCSSIYETIGEDLYDIYKVNKMNELAENAIRAELESKLDNDELKDLVNVGLCVQDILINSNFSDFKNGYIDDVDKAYEDLDGLSNVKAGKDGALKKIFKWIMKSVLSQSFLISGIPDRIISMCNEVEGNMDINAYSGLMSLSGTDIFTITDRDGMTSVEKMDVEFKSSPSIRVYGPGDNESGCIHYTGFFENRGMAYCTMFSVSIRDSLEFTARSAGPLEEAMGVGDAVLTETCPVELDFEIVVASGWALMGVKGYTPSTTLLNDVLNIAMDILEPLIEPLRKIAEILTEVLSVIDSALMEIAKYVSDMVMWLYDALSEPLTQLANALRDLMDSCLSGIMEKLENNIENSILINEKNQIFEFELFGFHIKIAFDVASLAKTTKNLVTLSMGLNVAGIDLEGSMTVKKKSKEFIVVGSGSISGKTWDIKADLDPFMKSSNHLISINGHFKNMSMDVVMPEMVEYREIDLSLQDIPGIGTMLSNIPIGAAKASIDAGLNVKYRAPFENGLMINEFEQNPEGIDSENEWVELYNATTETINLEGYTLTAGSGKNKVYTLNDVDIRAGGRLLVNLPGSFLNNSGNGTLKGGENITLKDSEGTVLDKTPTKKDESNDTQTWQRVADGSLEWVFEEGTPGDKNCGGLLTGPMIKTNLINIAKETASETLHNMGNLTSVQDISEFFQIVMQNMVTVCIETVADCLVEASVYVSVEVTDAASAGCVGFEIALIVDSDFAEQGLKALIGEMEELLFNIDNPYGLNPKQVAMDNTYLGIKLYAGMNTPKFMNNSEKYPEIQICVDVRTNLSAIKTLMGDDSGIWKLIVGVKIKDCPALLIPPQLGADPNIEHDVWLLKATFKRS